MQEFSRDEIWKKKILVRGGKEGEMDKRKRPFQKNKKARREKTKSYTRKTPTRPQRKHSQNFFLKKKAAGKGKNI